MSRRAGRLFESVKRRRWRGSKALVPILLADGCPACGAALDQETIGEAPLLRHGGYGAMRESVRLHCRCGWSLLQRVTEVRP